MKDDKTMSGGKAAGRDHAADHTIHIDNRQSLVVTDVCDVESFAEDTVLLTLSQGGLVIKGENLHMQGLDLEAGKASLTGKIQSMTYTEKSRKVKNFWARLLK